MDRPRLEIDRHNDMQDEAAYVCDHCGETIVIPVDFSAGRYQEYGEDCPICCSPNRIRLEIDPHGDVRAWGESE